MHSKTTTEKPAAGALKRYAPLAILLIGLIGFFAFDLQQYFDFEKIKSGREDLRLYVDNNFAQSVALYSLTYITVIALSLPLGSVLTLLGGFLFGLVHGTLIVVTSATIGAAIIFLVAKSALGNTLREKAGGLYKKIAHNFNENAFAYLLSLRLAPLFPFGLVNILPAIVGMKTSQYVLATFIGIIPGTAVYVYAGQSLGNLESPKDIASPSIITAFVLLSLMGLIPTIIKKIRSAKKDAQNNETA